MESGTRRMEWLRQNKLRVIAAVGMTAVTLATAGEAIGLNEAEERPAAAEATEDTETDTETETATRAKVAGIQERIGIRFAGVESDTERKQDIQIETETARDVEATEAEADFESKCDQPDTPEKADQKNRQYAELSSEFPALSCLAELGQICIDAPNVTKLCVDHRRGDYVYSPEGLRGTGYVMVGENPKNYAQFYEFTLYTEHEECLESFHDLSGKAHEELKRHKALESVKIHFSGWQTDCIPDKARQNRYGIKPGEVSRTHGARD